MVSVDYELRKKVMDAHIGDSLKYCYQCSRCTDVCPVAKVAPDKYNPRANIMLSFLGVNIFKGQKDNMAIWGCTVCDTCDEVCPQKVELTEIFTILKNMSIERGEGPEYYTTQASTILENGKAIPMQPAIERRREQMGLPPIMTPDVAEVKKLLQATGLPGKLPKSE